MRRALFVLPALVGLAACHVVHPPGWAATEGDPERIHATPGVMYGWAPLSYDLPDGRVVRVEVDRIRRTLAETEAAFSLVDETGTRLRCATLPADDELEPARLGCWSPNRGTTLRVGSTCVGMGPSQVMMNATCWEGTLLREGEFIALRWARLERSGVPVGRISWVGRDGPLLAANIQLDTRFDTWTVRALEPALREDLLLATIAVAWFEHAATSD